ncbi:MAG: glycosyltransferase [Clostridia bacterium]|nr:glycosyltransferase [Clostridia bacterium]
MRIVFVSNYFNHHQRPLSDALYKICAGEYYFISTAEMSAERRSLGYGEDNIPTYVKYTYKTEAERLECQALIDSADVVICGSAPYAMLTMRLKKGLLTFKYCERPYKKGVSLFKRPLHMWRAFRKYTRFKNFYVLCASAYTPVDFSKMGAFIGKTYKWGYFTALKEYENVDALITEKTPASILWVARFIPLKHPEFPLELAKRLKDEGYTFKLGMIGNGELEEAIRASISRMGLSDCVELLGTMKPDAVRAHMEKNEIFIFTSDRNEGWGAVLNESMNSACAVVANSAIGSVPFLLTDGENGYMYRDGDFEDFYNKVKKLLDDADTRLRLSRNAYTTMAEEWNAENAARKLVVLCEQMLAGAYRPFPHESGVCSKAKILKDGWYK